MKLLSTKQVKWTLIIKWIFGLWLFSQLFQKIDKLKYGQNNVKQPSRMKYVSIETDEDVSESSQASVPDKVKFNG